MKKQILAAALAALSIAAVASPVTDEYVAMHRAGTLFAGDPRLDSWRANTSDRSIDLVVIREDDKRTYAWFHERATVRGVPTEAKGLIEILHEGGKIVGAEWTQNVGQPGVDLAAAGQWADVGSTALGLAAGFAEANPLGFAALPMKFAMHQSTLAMDLHACIDGRTSMGAVGNGLGAMNLATIAGLGPVGIIVGLIVGQATSDAIRKDAALHCATGE